ncbi:DeoR/GlpR family DNA-binding transcription regulator [Dactylosporangium sp. CS-033363]|uniref:DeoR/GlpR family DNA-binding transcription regulator n=1 Tax=Dactylosporangium sp. CS-033363 TaxID=3239935 RepID=UPI003D94C33F
MLIAERRRRLLEEVRDRGYASFQELAGALDISESTVRRDLRTLIDDGLLAATRGGVGPVPAEPSEPEPAASGPAGPGPAEPQAAAPGDPAHREREAIAARAAALVEPGSAILLGPGRTTTALARHLSARAASLTELTVVTNSITVTQALAGAPQIEVVLIGGALRRSIGAVVGPIAEHNLRGLRGAQVFLSGEGVTLERGLTTPNVFAAATDQALAAAGRRVVVLADHAKLGRDTMCQTVPPDRIGVLVTGADGSEVAAGLRGAGAEVLIAGGPR